MFSEKKIVRIAKATDTWVNLRINPQRRSLKGVLLLFIEPYTAGARDSEKYFNPDLTKITVTINGSPNMLFNNGIFSHEFWKETSHFFLRKSSKKQIIKSSLI